MAYLPPLPFKLVDTEGKCSIRLEQLQQRHAADLKEAAEAMQQKHSDVFQWLFDYPLMQIGMDVYVYEMSRPRTETIAFAIIDLKTQKAVGVTRFLHIDDQHKVAEMATWMKSEDAGEDGRLPLSRNKQSKWLMLRTAFDEWDRQRIEWKVDVRNFQSSKPLLDIGAQPEGVLFNHLELTFGYRRSSIVFGMVRDLWDRKLKAHLSTFYLSPDAILGPDEAKAALDQMYTAIKENIARVIEESKEAARVTLSH